MRRNCPVKCIFAVFRFCLGWTPFKRSNDGNGVRNTQKSCAAFFVFRLAVGWCDCWKMDFVNLFNRIDCVHVVSPVPHICQLTNRNERFLFDNVIVSSHLRNESLSAPMVRETINNSVDSEPGDGGRNRLRKHSIGKYEICRGHINDSNQVMSPPNIDYDCTRYIHYSRFAYPDQKTNVRIENRCYVNKVRCSICAWLKITGATSYVSLQAPKHQRAAKCNTLRILRGDSGLYLPESHFTIISRRWVRGNRKTWWSE